MSAAGAEAEMGGDFVSCLQISQLGEMNLPGKAYVSWVVFADHS